MPCYLNIFKQRKLAKHIEIKNKIEKLPALAPQQNPEQTRMSDWRLTAFPSARWSPGSGAWRQLPPKGLYSSIGRQVTGLAGAGRMSSPEIPARVVTALGAEGRIRSQGAQGLGSCYSFLDASQASCYQRRVQTLLLAWEFRTKSRDVLPLTPKEVDQILAGGWRHFPFVIGGYKTNRLLF